MSDNTSSIPPVTGGQGALPVNSNWERETLEKVLLATLKEQRAARRWSIFFKLLILGVISFRHGRISISAPASTSKRWASTPR
jgi:protease-4